MVEHFNCFIFLSDSFLFSYEILYCLNTYFSLALQSGPAPKGESSKIYLKLSPPLKRHRLESISKNQHIDLLNWALNVVSQAHFVPQSKEKHIPGTNLRPIPPYPFILFINLEVIYMPYFKDKNF